MNVGDRYVWVHNNHGMAPEFVWKEFTIQEIKKEYILITYCGDGGEGNWTKEVIEKNARLVKRQSFQTLYEKLL